jgi:hypothetical protein
VITAPRGGPTLSTARARRRPGPGPKTRDIRVIGPRTVTFNHQVYYVPQTIIVPTRMMMTRMIMIAARRRSESEALDRD